MFVSKVDSVVKKIGAVVPYIYLVVRGIRCVSAEVVFGMERVGSVVREVEIVV